MSVLEALVTAVAQGNLLHGSPKRHECLEPRQARDETGRSVGCLEAVYATDDLRIAVVMAMFSRADASIRSHRSFYTTKGTQLRVGGDNVTFKPGWVHVLPRHSFKSQKAGGAEEIISLVSVKPVAWIFVEPAIIPRLYGTIVEFPFDPLATG